MSLDLASTALVGKGRATAPPPTGARHWPAWLVPGLPAALALALGLWGLSRQGAIWRDEAATWEVAERSLSEIWHMTGHVDLVHGLYYLLIHAIFEVFGPHLMALRLPSVLGAVVAVAVTAATARRLAGPLAGVAAGLALAVLPVMQRYGQEGRSFTLVAAGVAVATWLLTGALGLTGPAESATPRSERRRRPAELLRWTAYAAVMLATTLLNWLSLFALAAHGVTVLIARRRGQRPLLARWLVAAAVIFAGTLPLIVASSRQARQVAWIQPPSAGSLLGVAAMLIVALACTRAPGQARAPRSPAAVGLPLLAVPHLGLLLASWLVKPLYVDRYVLFASIGLSLLAGPALAWVAQTLASRIRTRHRRPGRPRAGALLAGIVAVALLALLPLELSLRTPESRTDDVRAAAAQVATVAHPGDGIVFIPAHRRDAALLTPASFRGLDDLALAEAAAPSGTLYGTEAAPADIRAAMLTHRRIIVLSDSGSAPAAATAQDRAKLATLAQHFTPTASGAAGGRQVTAYERNP
ncbi:glycosyltransferase family 39 protein [Streptomyces sp. NPDC057743]|uniref:glycosyltransferase family 39 protein n=1 Tax=Streptomyces sp. NPDC057743 TaxID=3346236 RepID=UPI0036D116E8